MADLTLYGNPISTYVRSVRMVCEEKGIAYELEPLWPQQCFKRGLHPFAKMPAMAHGDFKLYETAAIARYLDEGFDGPSLQPADPQGRARMEQWIGVVSCYLYDSAVRRCVLQYAFPKGPDGQPDRATIDAGAADAARHLRVLEAAYDGRPFLVGETPSLADLFLAPILAYLKGLPEGPGLLDPLPQLRHGMAAMEDRGSYAATQPPAPERPAVA